MSLPAPVDIALDAVAGFRWIGSTYIIEYHVAQHAERLPQTWRTALRNAPLRDVAALMLGGPVDDPADLDDLADLDGDDNDDNDDGGTERDQPTSRATRKQPATLVPSSILPHGRPPRPALPSSTLPHRPPHPALPSAVWPLELLAYRALCVRAALDRRPRPPVGVAELDAALRIGVGAKKQHELARLVPLVRELVRTTGALLVVDVGSGVGHLARAIAYEAGVDVVAIEGNAALVATAHERDDRTRTLLQDRARHGDARATVLLAAAGTVRHVHAHLPTSLDAATFAAVVVGDGAVPLPPLVLVGLHTCGDLGPTLLRQYLDVPSIRGVVSVGCCYMHLTEPNAAAAADDAAAGILGPAGGAKPASPRAGYPLSLAYAAQLPRAHLGWKLRELACHSLDAYRVRYEGATPGGLLEELRAHGYRAALEVLLRDLDPANVRLALGSLKGGWARSFRAYALAALERLGLVAQVAAAAAPLDWQKYEALAAEWEEVAKFVCVRLAFSPVVETVLLRDRVAWLREQGHAATLVPLFDPLVSPRNFAIFATKLPGAPT